MVGWMRGSCSAGAVMGAARAPSSVDRSSTGAEPGASTAGMAVASDSLRALLERRLDSCAFAVRLAALLGIGIDKKETPERHFRRPVRPGDVARLPVTICKRAEQAWVAEKTLA